MFACWRDFSQPPKTAELGKSSLHNARTFMACLHSECCYDYGYDELHRKMLEITQKVQVKTSLDNNDVEKEKCATKGCVIKFIVLQPFMARMLCSKCFVSTSRECEEVHFLPKNLFLCKQAFTTCVVNYHRFESSSSDNIASC